MSTQFFEFIVRPAFGASLTLLHRNILAEDFCARGPLDLELTDGVMMN